MNKDSEVYLEPIAFVVFHYVNEVSSISSFIETEKISLNARRCDGNGQSLTGTWKSAERLFLDDLPHSRMHLRITLWRMLTLGPVVIWLFVTEKKT
jgi:hypothetical protein